MKTRSLFAAVLLVSAVAASADVKKVFRSEEKFTIAPNGVFVLENPFGDVVVEGAGVTQVEATVSRTITGTDAAAIEEGRQQTGLIVGGDRNTRVVRVPAVPSADSKWQATTDWRVRVPAGAGVQILSRASRRIIVNNVRGPVRAKNFNGNIHLTNTTGPVLAESVNGSMHYQVNRPAGSVVLRSVNGGLTASVGREAQLHWVAETVKGEILSNLPVRGAMFGNGFRGSLNAPGGPTITMATLMGNVQLIAIGERIDTIQSLRKSPALPAGGATPAGQPAPPSHELIQGRFQYATNLGDVRVQQIRGDADIFTGAGEVELGAVTGGCKVRSLGGPLRLGEVFGPLQATTRAGDILVDSARQGGSIDTQGGTIRLLYTGGPTRLYSGGGDIIVRQAAGPVNATTKSGDVTIQVDPASRTERVEATTAKGSVVLNVAPKFGAEVDLLIVTGDPAADTIVSEIPGLSISREQVDGKTQVRATGKLNGGGERVVLRATDGDIRITTKPLGPTVIERR